jgi:lysophospholipase L1-like esterase
LSSRDATPDEERRPAPRAPRRLAFALATVLIALAALEVGQRISDARKEERRAAQAGFRRETTRGTPLDDALGGLVLELDDLRGYRLRPNQRAGAVSINERGFRGGPMPDAKAPGERRVIVLGGSTAYGYLLDETEKVFPAVLERRLAAAPPPGAASVSVWNCGVVGYDSAQELALLAHDLAHAAPDLVILFDGWNDLHVSGRTPPGAPLRTGGFGDLEARVARTEEPLRGLLRASAFFRGLERKAARFRLEAEERAAAGRPLGVFAEHPAALPRYRRNLTAAVRLARAFGARALLAPQPEAHLRAEPVPEAEARVRAEERAPGYSAYARAVYPKFRDAAREVAAAEGAAYLDATRLFDGREERVFLDDCHLDPAGMEVVAAALEPVVRELLSGVR